MAQAIRKNLEPFLRLDSKMTVELDPAEQSVVRLKGRLSGPMDPKALKDAPHATARRIIAANKALFGAIDEKTELVDGRATTDSAGMTHVLLEQKYGDAPVLGAAISVHFKQDGTLHLLDSSLERAIDAPKVPKIPADQAQRIALTHAGKEAVAMTAGKFRPKLVVASSEYLRLADTRQKFHMCWEVCVDQPRQKQPAAWIYFVDAIDGKVLLRYSGLIAGTGTGYHSGGGAIITEASGGQFVAQDDVTSATWAGHPQVQTKRWSTGNLATDDNDVWADAPDEASEKVEVDIHRYLGYVLSYYHLHFGHDGWDHAGGDAIAYAHFSDPNNAYWHTLTNTIRVGDGKMADASSNYYPFSAFDVIAHEFTHGVNDGFNVVQTYLNETGALNEGLADSFAALASLNYPGEDPQPWVNGEKVYAVAHPRSLADPARDSAGVVHYDATSDATKITSAIAGYFPDHYSIRYMGTGDYGGVHVNCPIIGHAIFLMVNGGTHRLSGIAVAGIGPAPVERMLYYTISTPGLLNNSSNFADFRRGMLLACEMLFPDNLDYLVTVKNAFKAVGIGPDLYVRDFVGDTGVEPGTALSCMSPDIISRKSAANAAVLAQMGDIANGGLCEKIELGQDNSVYFRIFNGGSANSGGTFRLFLAPASSFPNPAAWHEVGSYFFPPIAAGAYWVPTAADQCITLPSALIATLGTGHFCFIGVIETDQDPAPDRMQIHNIADFYAFIQKSNNYAWRNCDIEDVMLNVLQPAVIAQKFMVNGFGPVKQAVEFEIDTTNLPRGAIVQLLLPKVQAGNLLFTDVQRKSPLPVRLNIGQVPRAIPVEQQKVVARPAAEFAMKTEEMLFEHGMLDRMDVATMRAIRLGAARITRVTGPHLDGKEGMPVNFVVSIPAGTGARDVFLSFRQTYKGAPIGQMNYLFRLRTTK